MREQEEGFKDSQQVSHENILVCRVKAFEWRCTQRLATVEIQVLYT